MNNPLTNILGEVEVNRFITSARWVLTSARRLMNILLYLLLSQYEQYILMCSYIPRWQPTQTRATDDMNLITNVGMDYACIEYGLTVTVTADVQVELA